MNILHLSQVAIKIVSMAEAPAEYSRKFLPREILSLNATYKHMNIVRRSLPCQRSTPLPHFFTWNLLFVLA